MIPPAARIVEKNVILFLIPDCTNLHSTGSIKAKHHTAQFCVASCQKSFCCRGCVGEQVVVMANLPIDKEFQILKWADGFFRCDEHIASSILLNKVSRLGGIVTFQWTLSEIQDTGIIDIFGVTVRLIEYCRSQWRGCKNAIGWHKILRRCDWTIQCE